MYEIYAYGNVDTLTGVFNAIAAIMGGAGYLGLIKTVAVTGVMVASCAGLFSPGRFQGWGWMMGFLLLYNALFLPRATVVVVDKLGNQTPAAIDNIPVGLAFFGHYTSRVGDVMTGFFETAFQILPAGGAQLPSELAYQKNGVMFGNRLIEASRSAKVRDPQLRTDLISYIHNCTLYDLQDGTIDPAAFSRSTDLWSLMGNPNPARFAAYGLPVKVDACPAVYHYLAQRLPAEIAQARSLLALQMNPGLDATAAQGRIDGQLEQAYIKTRIASAAQGVADLLRQNILINLIEDTQQLAGQRMNDPAALMLSTARANATAATNASFLTMGKIAEQALPLIRNTVEAILYAVFPFVFLLLLLAQGKGLGLALKSFVLSLVWVQLWPPLYAILNYVATLASARNLEAAARMTANAQGLALETAASIYHGAISDQAVAGYLVISIPIIATAIIKGGEVAFQAVTASSALQSAASSEASSTSKGLISQNSVSLDQQQLAPNRTSAFMSTSTEANGTTVQGIGPEAGTFRYQTTMSRLPTTFTFSERQANSIAASAREAETFAKTEREAMQRSQATAITEALGIQHAFEQSRQNTTNDTTSKAGTTSTQLQTVQSIAREVNRRLGLNEESAVGASIAASASAGAKIPLTQIGGVMSREGRTVSEERLHSAYDYARKTATNEQISDTTSVMNEFRTSDAYAWAQSQKEGNTRGFDRSERQATEHQSTSDTAYSNARELGRTAQFMREWSSGAQTDFTNYAAQRLAERGLLKEQDPIKLQHAITGIARSYANGGHTPSAYVSLDSPLSPSVPAAALDWQSDTLRTLHAEHSGTSPETTTDTRQNNGQKEPQIATNQQAEQHIAQIQEKLDDNAARIERSSADLQEEYNNEVRREKTNERHGGNKATLDTIGAQSINRAELHPDR